MIKRFKDIEVSADTGEVRLYTTDNDYTEYTSETLLNLLNEQDERIQELEKEDKRLKQEHRQLQIDFNDLVGINTNYRELTYDLTDLIEDLGSEEMKRQMYEILKKSHISEFKSYAVEESKKYG